jgi:uncharacterized protein YlaI
VSHDKTHFRCNKCQKLFKVDERDQHMLNKHPADEFLCGHCDHAFETKTTLTKHQRDFAYEIECWKNGCGKII